MPFLPVGGQAVIEGVMMRSPSRIAVAVRRPDGSIAVNERAFKSVIASNRLLKLPVIRGAVSLFETLFIGVTALNWSAEEASREVVAEGAAATIAEAPGTPPATAPSSAKGAAAMSALQGVAMIAAFALGLFLFVILPARLTGWVGFHDRFRFGLVDGGFRLLFFMLYLLLISQWKEMARVLGYHGAEHKAIHAIENRAPLTPESVQSFTRFHPRCGTTFLFLVVIVSIVVFTLIGRPTSVAQHLLRIASMPLIAGVAFEFIRLSGRFADQPIVRVLTWPGIQFQRLTTREPDLSMCEVAIAALERVRGDEAVLRLERATIPVSAEVAFIQ
jgi:uncharacterized protein YqhQ